MSDLYIICPHCGSSIAVDANYCPRCGTDLRPGIDDAPTAPPDTTAATEDGSPQSQTHSPIASQPVDDFQPANTKPTPQKPDRYEISDEISLSNSLSGLLDPVGLEDDWGGALLAMREQRTVAAPDAEELRKIRFQMLQEPILAALVKPLPPTHGVYRLRWIFGLLLLALLMPYFLPSSSPILADQSWRGVTEARQAIDSLLDGESVLLFWAYDPATAGEMDGVVYPLLRSLLRRNVPLETISLLPGGIATARRMVEEIMTKDGKQSAGKLAYATLLSTYHFVPGGVSALPLIGEATCDSSAKENANTDGCATASPPNRSYCVGKSTDESVGRKCGYALVIVIAAQAEDVQQWLELAQPLNQIPVVAVTSAAADLPLLPYFESEQLVGLVGGFDGAANYLTQDPSLLGDEEWNKRLRALYQLRWGHGALLLVIFLANLVAMGRVRGEE